ncbi:hypothetical protein [Mycobacterium sp. PSTR-4-N]|uniref:hypothetical protein n=1 Tax=Mycobacterium sp. PSTR-4-N TaxID=2917745 RepID=UPI001F15587C|nr:hypothetical protein [Mycobacterium sp. PSTR-4-N]MCG7594989.1 hypothetical protein [Mycobacterium sp. PSTR-4-N]
MPFIDSVDPHYYLLEIGRDGVEQAEHDGTLLSTAIVEAVRTGVTDIFIASHGWKGDVTAALEQYGRWFPTVAQQDADRALVATKVPGFTPLIVGVHWPSLPWGDEGPARATLGADDDALAEEAAMDTSGLVERYADRIATSPEALAALERITAVADDEITALQIQSGQMPAELEADYRRLFAAGDLSDGSPEAAPGADLPEFSPQDTAQQWIAELRTAGPATGNPGVLGDGLLASARDIILAPVRQLSFWTMKKRARVVGERDVHRVLRDLQIAAPSARLHLMGHSFGCIVMTAAVAGPVSGGVRTDPLPRPVDTLFLVQGAMSLWSFADQIPYAPFGPGFYRAVRAQPPAVRGAVATTRSSHDKAVGTWYPLGARIGRDHTLGPGDLPEWGGIGSYGIQGTGSAEDLRIDEDVRHQYGFVRGGIYNADADAVITGGDRLSGAHSNFVNDSVAHLFWQAVLPSL